MAYPVPRPDPLSSVDAYGAVRPEIWRSASNRPFFAAYRPSVLSLASALTHLKGSPEVQIEAFVPVPDGMYFAENCATGQMQLILNPMYARRFRRIFGYVDEIRLPPAAKGNVSRSPSFFLHSSPDSIRILFN